MMRELVGEIKEMKKEMRSEREERRRLEEEWRGERRKWEEWMKEEKARREGIEETLERLEERDRRMEEVMGKLESWEKEVVEEGQVEEWRMRLRRLEVMQDKKEREGRRCNVVIRGLGGRRRRGGGGGEGALGEDGIGEGGYKRGEKDRKSGRGGPWNGAGEIGGKGRKRKVMEARRKLRDGKARIEDDLTEEERRGRWKIEREAERERREGEKCADRVHEDVGEWEVEEGGTR